MLTHRNGMFPRCLTKDSPTGASSVSRHSNVTARLLHLCKHTPRVETSRMLCTLFWSEHRTEGWTGSFDLILISNSITHGRNKFNICNATSELGVQIKWARRCWKHNMLKRQRRSLFVLFWKQRVCFILLISSALKCSVALTIESLQACCRKTTVVSCCTDSTVVFFSYLPTETCNTKICCESCFRSDDLWWSVLRSMGLVFWCSTLSVHKEKIGTIVVQVLSLFISF